MFTTKSLLMMGLFCSLAMASCQKTYTCHCSPSPIASEVTKHEIEAANKAEANRKCKALTPDVGIGGAPVCRLK